MKPSILSQADSVPPFLCYIAAIRGKATRPSRPELIRDAKVSPRTFDRIVSRTSWAGVTVAQMDQVSRACGVDLLNPDGVLSWIRQEMNKPIPFPELAQRGNPRKTMLKKLELLCKRKVVAQRSM